MPTVEDRRRKFAGYREDAIMFRGWSSWPWATVCDLGAACCVAAINVELSGRPEELDGRLAVLPLTRGDMFSKRKTKS